MVGLGEGSGYGLGVAGWGGWSGGWVFVVWWLGVVCWVGSGDGEWVFGCRVVGSGVVLGVGSVGGFHFSAFSS